MELSEFVSQSLVAIAKAVKKADDDLREIQGAAVNPLSASWRNDRDFGVVTKESQLQRVELINFDVAVTVEGGMSTKGGIGVLGGIVNLGSTGETDSKRQAVSKIQFSIPLALPASWPNR